MGTNRSRDAEDKGRELMELPNSFDLLKEVESLKRENQRLKQIIGQINTEEDDLDLPPALLEQLQKEYLEKILLAKQKVRLDKDIRTKTKEQAQRVLARAYLSQDTQKKFQAFTKSYRLIQEKLHAEKAKVSQELMMLNEQRKALVNEVNPQQSAQVQKNHEAKIAALSEGMKAVNLRYEEAAKPLNAEIKTLREEQFPIIRRGIHHYQLIKQLSAEIEEESKTLHSLVIEREPKNRELGVPPQAPEEFLSTFGGSRLVRYRLTPEERKKLSLEFAKAIDESKYTEAELLLRKGAEIDFPYLKNQYPVLLSIILVSNTRDTEHPANRLKAVSWLVSHGANPNPTTHSARSFMINHGSLEMAKGSTPLMILAAQYGWNDEVSQLVKLLLSKGAKLDAKDDKGWTALHWAALWKSKGFCECFIANGAELEVTDKEGKTPYQVLLGARTVNPSGLSPDQWKQLLQPSNSKTENFSFRKR